VTSRDTIDAVLRNYPVTTFNVREETEKAKKAVWWVEASEGLMVLKKLPMGEERLLFLIAALEHLRKGGVRLAALVKAHDGKLYSVVDSTCYTLALAVKGRTPSYSSPKELAMMVRELARFHKASEGFKAPTGSKARSHLGTWPESYLREVGRLHPYLEEAGDSPFAQRVREVLERHMEMAREALAGLDGGEYRAWVDQVTATGNLCHQDFAAGNLVLTPAGEICVLDTDSLTVDLPARDIRKILNKIMKKRGAWDLDLALELTRLYGEVNPLMPEHLKVLGLDLLFPHLFFGIATKYLEKREKEWSASKFLKKLESIVALEDQKVALVRRLVEGDVR
jgi:spore coat-associated protein S